MCRFAYFLAAMAFTSTSLWADSIRVGERFYRDVYIRTGADFYYVHHPEEGRIERVSRRRSNVSDVTISPNAACREGLLARYREKVASPAEAPVAAATLTHTLDGDLVKHQRQMRDLAVFESQLEHWRILPDEVREDIAAGLYETLEARTARRAAERERALVQREQLGATKVAVEQELESAAQARAAAVQQARSEDASDFYLRAYENSKGYVPSYQLYIDECENLRTVPVWWYTEVPALYDAALGERARVQAEIDAVEQTYAKQASAYGSTLDSVERGIQMRERAARAAVSKVIDDRHRIGGQQARVAALADAADAGYLPQLHATEIASWLGAAAQRLPEFTVGRGLWRIDCAIAGSGEGFAATLYDAKTGTPFTRIAGADFLGMRTRVFDRAGRYYLVVEQGLMPAPFDIRVSALAFR